MNNCTSYFKTFCDINRTMQKIFEIDKILQLIVDSAVEAMDGKACALFLKSRNENNFDLSAQNGLSTGGIHAGPLKTNKAIHRMLKQGGAFAVRDSSTDPEIKDHEAIIAEGVISILYAPVIADEKAIGILAFYPNAPREFDTQEIEFFTGLADQSGMAIQKARFIKRQKQNAALLLSITENLNSTLNIKKILTIMSAEITKTFNVKGITIRLVDEEVKELKLVASYGLSEKYINKGPVPFETLKHRLIDPWEIIPDTPFADIDYYNEKKDEDIASILTLPLTVKDEVIGIMRVYCDKKRKFQEDTVSLIASIARMGGLAIQNASMYLQLKNDKEALEKEIWVHKSWF